MPRLTTVLMRNKTRFLRLANETGGFVDLARSNLTNELELINKSLFANNFMYEKFPFYAVLFLIAFNMIFEFGKLIFEAFKRRRRARQEKDRQKCSCCKKTMQSGEDAAEDSEYEEEEEEEDARRLAYETDGIGKVHHEIKYTKELFKPGIRKPPSFVKYFFENYVYKNRKDFRYSKQFINTHIIAFILLYYITCIIIRKSTLIVSISSNLLILVVNFLFKMNPATDNSGFMLVSRNQLNKLIISLYDNISSYIVIAACITTTIYLIQLFVGIRNYHQHVLNAYKGVYVDIPAPSRFSNAKLASSSLHYR
jgi:hypothetical protein